MTVNELIALLQTMPADDHVFLVIDNHRHPVADVTNDFGDNCVDINARVDDENLWIDLDGGLSATNEG